MSPQDEEIEKMRKGITKDVTKVLTSTLKHFDWDIPENDDRKSAELILSAMEDTMKDLKNDIESGKYDYY